MVFLATRYWLSKISDHVLQNTIAHGRRLAVNISDKLDEKINLYGKKTPPQIRINRIFAFRLYRMLGSFYIQNPNTVFVAITPSRVILPKDNKSKFATSRETYSVDLLPRCEESSQLWICYVPKNLANFISIQFIVIPLLGLTWIIHCCLFCRNGLIPNSGFIPNSDLVQITNYRSKWLLEWEFSKKIRLLKLEVRQFVQC